jgi:hypothetical protein
LVTTNHSKFGNGILKVDEKEEKPTEPTDDDIKKGKFWPMAYLFSNAQVIKR